MSNIATAMIILLPSLTACAPKPMKWECPKLHNSAFNSSVDSNHSDPKTVKIQIDGTLSMQGFVKIDSSRYVQTLDYLDRAVTTAFTNSKVKYYRFGISSEELKGEQNSQKAQSSAFYSSKDPNLKDAKFNAVMKPASKYDADEMLIVVTDLYQKESSQESPIIKLIKENYIQKGNAIGILAVKSEFKGTVYDVGKQDKKFEWTTEKNRVNKFHPFYIILLGKYKNIVDFFDQLKGNNISFFENEKFIIYYPQVLEKLLFLNISDNESKRDLPQGINSRKSINDGHIRLELENPNSTDTDILKISKKYDEDSQKEIAYAINYSPLPYTLQIEPKTKPITSEIFRESNNNFDHIDSELIKFSQWKIQDKTLSFVTNLNSVKETGVYRFVFDVFPSKLKGQSWWSTWSFNEEEAKSWSIEPKNFDGSRTYNLLPFLQSLSEITLQQIESSKSPIGRFCYVIHKE
ncbi:hypothetical protein [uncultured Nostoc sp.]|uniref:hypothetical protein n=1 Tax=uncultured Nostoc sp. TaxID=340711 RepID=UPI0035CB7EDB